MVIKMAWNGYSERSCQKCGEACGGFAEYCQLCGTKLPPIFFSEAEYEEKREHDGLIMLLFGGCSQLFHSFLRVNSKVIFCPHCGDKLYSTVN
jgi:hypothetical protein